MNRDAKHAFRISVIILLFVVIITYAYFQSRRILEGPRITIDTPKNGERVSDSLISIKGNAEKINSISLDDRPIYIDEAGNINEKLLLFPGYNIMKIEAHDKFGKDKMVKIEVVYDAPADQISNFADNASSTVRTAATSTTGTSSLASSSSAF
jgi:hypothetical protein